MSFLKVKLAVIAVLLGFVSMASAKVKLDNEKSQFSYTLGAQIARDLMQSGLQTEIEQDALVEGMKDLLSNTKLKMTPEQMQAAQQAFQQKQKKQFEELAAKNKAKGEKYLADNKAKSKVKTTKSGLQYEVLRKGKGKQPTSKDIISVHYSGSLPDGKVFDSTYKNNQPVDFDLSGGLIQGMLEGMLLMKEGAKYRFSVPSDLAYGKQGSRLIGPNQVLVFELELLEIKK